jgi:hypothetical protein
MSVRFTSIFVAFAALASVQSAIACSCVRRDPAVAPTEKVVILAKVAKLEKKPSGAGPWDVTIVVERSWQGPWHANATLRVQTPGPSGTCGFFIHVGDEMLVYSDDPAMMDLALCNTVRGEDVTRYIRAMDQAQPSP